MTAHEIQRLDRALLAVSRFGVTQEQLDQFCEAHGLPWVSVRSADPDLLHEVFLALQ